jgi:receptor protein-tyrosine kinase
MGQQLVFAGKLSEEEVMRIVDAQIATGLRFGEMGMRLGMLTEEDVNKALARQYGYSYLTPNDTRLSPQLYAAFEPFGARSEAIRELRSQLSFRWFNDRFAALVITSARRGEGASSVAANLAIAFAQLGERTALIDADMRRPAQHRLFGLNPAEGLSGLLVGRASVKEIFTPVNEFENLFVACAGAVPPNPQELLGRVNFSYLIESAPASFDVVIIDAPPLLECADAQLPVARARGCVLSTRLNKTSLTDLEKVRSFLHPTGAQIVGTVVNE